MADESCWATTTLRCFQWFCLHCLIQHKHTVLIQSKLRFLSLKLNTFSYTQIHPGFVRITHIFIFDAWQNSRSKSKKLFKEWLSFKPLQDNQSRRRERRAGNYFPTLETAQAERSWRLCPRRMKVDVKMNFMLQATIGQEASKNVSSNQNFLLWSLQFIIRLMTVFNVWRFKSRISKKSYSQKGVHFRTERHFQ